MYSPISPLEAAETVCQEPLALDLLAQLRECSLVLTEEKGAEIRFRMLETLLEFGQEQLKGEEHRELEGRHRAFFLNMAETSEVYRTVRESSHE